MSRFKMKTDTCGQAKTIRIRYRVDANFFEIRNKKVAFSNENGYLWSGPKNNPICSCQIIYFLDYIWT